MSVRVLQVLGGTQFGGAIWVVRDYVEALQDHGCTVAVCASVDSVAEVFERKGCEIVPIDEMCREIDPRRDIVALAKLARLCRDRRFDVVHTHTSKGGFLGRAAARLAGVPVVIHTAHGFAFHESSSSLSMAFYTRLERLAGRWCDCVATVSEFHHDWALKQRLASPEKIVTLRNGISRARLVVSRGRHEVRRELSIDDGDVLLLSTARLAGGKGLEALILAMPEVLKRDDRVRLVLVGEGPSRLDLEAQARTAGVASAIRFLGFRSDIGDMLNASDVVVAASRREGLSISVLEAMAMGKAIVATNIGSNLELVEDGVSGLLVPPDDPGALAEAILRLAANPDVASRYGDEAMERYERDFTQRAMKEAVWNLYEQLLREKQVGRVPYEHVLDLSPDDATGALDGVVAGRRD